MSGIDRATARRRNVMLGPPPTARGGIATVVAQYRDHGLFEKLDIVYLPTFATGGAWAKVRVAMQSLLRFCLLLLRGKVGVVHMHTASFTSFYRKAVFAWIAHAFGRPVVMHIHGGKFIEFVVAASPLARAFILRTLRRSACTIALSEHWAERFHAEFGIERARIAAVPNPVSRAERTMPRPAPKQLLFLGDIIRKKGIYELVDALSLLKARGMTVELRCGGLGEIDAVTAYAAERGIDDELRMLGWVNADARADEFRRADLFVLPSHAEGLPMTILEAMAAGVPVLASEVGGIPDMLQQGKLGQIVASGDSAALAAAIERSLRDPADMQRRAELAYAVIGERYDPRVVGAQLLALYRSLSA